MYPEVDCLRFPAATRPALRRLIRRPSLHFSVLALALALVAAGCRTPIGVNRVGVEKAFLDSSGNALNTRVPSGASVQVLARNDLLLLYDKDPEEALRRLHERGAEEFDQDHALALAELSFLTGRETGKKDHLLAAAGYAYTYLFHPRVSGIQQPFDPRFRLACDLYNCSLSEFLKGKDGLAVLADGVHPLPFGTVKIKFTRPGFPWGPEEFGRFVPALDFSIRGLRSRQVNPGLGAPLVGMRALRERKSEGDNRLAGGFRSFRAKIAATAFLRFGRAKDPQAKHKEFEAELELYTPFLVNELQVEGHQVPLQSDLTAPLALGLEEPFIWSFELSGLLKGELADYPSGLYFCQPYQPGKVPVVFVHGTYSSPARWAETLNELMGDRTIRERCQFWFFLYNTGNAISYSGHLLRQALRDAVAEVDPDGKDLNLRRMVIVGHSQGGLLTKLQSIDPGEIFYERVTKEKFKDVEFSEEGRAFVRDLTVFDHLPFLSRVVFICTPHRGSFRSGGLPSRMLSGLIRTPRRLAEATRGAVKRDKDARLARQATIDVPTSIQNMEPGNLFLQLLEAVPIHPSIKAHSIIAVEGDGPLEEGNDGVVEYKSAHLDGVESERVIHWNHSLQSHPLAVLELRRILREHIQVPDSAQPAGS